MSETQFPNHLVFLPLESAWPIPDWEAVAAAEPADDPDGFWASMGLYWADYVAAYLGESFEVYESENFLLVSARGKEASTAIVRWLEKTHQRISTYLGPLACKDLYGKCAVFIFESADSYYEYISHYYEDGEYGGSGGIYINQGYGHFAFPFNEYVSAESVMAHELTHALIASEEMPVWLNEGITQLCEEAVSGPKGFEYDTIKDNIGHYWTPETIEAFWRGESFQHPDEGQALSYHLAELLVYRIIGDRERFDRFAQKARSSDAGDQALQEVFSFSLQELASSILGDDNWTFRKEIGTTSQ